MKEKKTIQADEHRPVRYLYLSGQEVELSNPPDGSDEPTPPLYRVRIRLAAMHCLTGGHRSYLMSTLGALLRAAARIRLVVVA